jgi:uncharacterized protein involved in exopolysaccharide biosynthesis/Mrp family chromosome partitioning ATPase
MNAPIESKEAAAPSGLNIHEVLSSFFKHKWKVIFFALAGLGAAAAAWFAHVPVYESRAKVLVKYVVDITPDLEKSLSNYNESFIQPEIEILTSWDIAGEVVEKIGAGRIVGGASGPSATGAAIRQIMLNLEVTVPRGSKVIGVAYRHTDPEVAVLVLNEVLARYEEKHGKVHRSSGTFEMVDKQKLEIKSDLEEIEKKLKANKDKANINDLAESAQSINRLMTSTRLELQEASVKLEAQRARVSEMERILGIKATPGADGAPKEAVPAPSQVEIQEYQGLIQRRERLRQREEELLTHLEPTSVDVKAIRNQIKSCETELAERLKASPGLTNNATPSAPGERPRLDLDSARAELRGLEAQHAALITAYAAAQQEWKSFREFAPKIDALEKEKEMQETNYKNKHLKLEQARAEELYDAKKMPNIEVIQKPSPPAPSTEKLLKIMLGLAFGGLAAGLGLVFIQEFVFDHSVRRPLELETRLGIPLMMAIPAQTDSDRLRLMQKTGSEDEKIVPWQEGHFIRPFAEAIRDRLVLHFEQAGLIRKPKLVGVTGWSTGAGTSTLASGLAAALSETGDGKVLLVDMNVRGGEVHPFFKGAEALLPDALKSGNNLPSAAENLYLATATTQNGEVEIIPKRFYNMIPNFKASDYDYIIFDMPPLSKGSMTLAMAGFMDRLLLVVEAEKDNRNVLKRACSELQSAKASLCGVLNKVRSYGPRWLQEA